MNRYLYGATDRDGEEVSGEIEAPDRRTAMAGLTARGYTAIALTRADGEDESDDPRDLGEALTSRLGSDSTASRVLRTEITFGKVPRSDLLDFTRMLAVYTEAGIPLVQAIDTLAAGANSRQMRQTLAQVAVQLRAGSGLVEALAKHPNAFGPMYLATLQAGETVGEISDALRQLAGHIERERDTRNQVMAFAVYPVIVVSLAALAAVVFTSVVFPRVAENLFTGLDDLPALPKALMAATTFMQEHGLVVALAAAGVASVLFLLRRTAAGQHMRDRLLLRVPMVAGVTRALVYERVCRSLSAMLAAGVNVPEALEVTADAANNRVYRDDLLQARAAVLQGVRLSDRMRATGRYDPTLVQLVRAGEDTGEMDVQLRIVARHYADEVVRKVRRTAQVGEPALLLAAATVVGLVAVSLVQVMYGSLDQVPGL